MFRKNQCKKCGKKINDKYEFCPYCGNTLNKNLGEDWGMLGKNDVENEFEQFPNSIFGGISGNMLGKMLNSAMKMLEKEMQDQNFQPRTNVRLMINGREIDLGNKRVKKQTHKAQKKVPLINLPQKILKKFSSLPKVEPKTNIRRFSDKVIYEIEMPGVKTRNDISIVQLENSIEIKGVAKDKAYHKLIPINLPITNYILLKEKLVLELGVKN